MANALFHSAQFFHRENWDSSLYSICRICYLTVGHGESEEDLREEEKATAVRRERVMSYRLSRSAAFVERLGHHPQQLIWHDE
jgi:hypothetical protein